MTRPIHSVKHLKTAYKKFQGIALICTAVTFVAVVVSSTSSIHLGSLIRIQKAESSRKAVGIETALTQKLDESKRQISDLQGKMKELDSKIKGLQAKNADLRKQLAMAKQPSPPQPLEPSTPGESITPSPSNPEDTTSPETIQPQQSEPSPEPPSTNSKTDGAQAPGSEATVQTPSANENTPDNQPIKPQGRLDEKRLADNETVATSHPSNVRQ